MTTFAARSYAHQTIGRCQNWIDGAFTDAVSGETLAQHNPRTGQLLGEVVMSDARDVARAVAVAKAAQVEWGRTPMKERAAVLFRLKYLIEKNLDELAWLISHENGKVIAEARADVEKAVECLEFGAGVPNAFDGGVLEVSRGVTCSVRHEPLGVVAGIVPYNFPLMVPLWMLPQALIGGNAFILKPSEKVPFTSARLAGLFVEAGLPKGLFQTVNGGRAVVEALCDDPGIKAVGFVGSTPVAKQVYARAAASGKRVLALGGAKNHLVLIPDADPEMTAVNVAASSMGCAGQRCMAASTLIAVGDVDGIVDGLVAKIRGMTLGADMGPVIDQAAVARVHRYVGDAVERGAKLRVDGRGATVAGFEGGYWVGPTVIDHVRPDMPAGCEEIFGPVLSIIRARTLDEAIAIENASPYGNAAVIYTSNGGTAEYAISRFQAGMCGVNVGVPVPREPFSFAGWNDSRFGAGDMTGADGYRFWTQLRKVTAKWALQKDATWMG
jgi:malonate-semialdehyde dehydrogenase (acetylating)/methylmalonate-semialdehyde dehydrogenase